MQAVDTSTLIQSAYDAAGSAEGWRGFLREYAEAFRAQGCLFIHQVTRRRHRAIDRRLRRLRAVVDGGLQFLPHRESLSACRAAHLRW
jgi:hypothetical protein